MDYKQLYNANNSKYTPRVIILPKDQTGYCNILLNANISFLTTSYLDTTNFSSLYPLPNERESCDSGPEILVQLDITMLLAKLHDGVSLSSTHHMKKTVYSQYII